VRHDVNTSKKLPALLLHIKRKTHYQKSISLMILDNVNGFRRILHFPFRALWFNYTM